jgi:hypothetical protein
MRPASLARMIAGVPFSSVGLSKRTPSSVRTPVASLRPEIAEAEAAEIGLACSRRDGDTYLHRRVRRDAKIRRRCEAKTGFETAAVKFACRLLPSALRSVEN